MPPIRPPRARIHSDLAAGRNGIVRDRHRNGRTTPHRRGRRQHVARRRCQRLKFLAGAGAILLTFLAGAELDPAVFRRQWKQATLIGRVSFAAPFLGCAAIARWVLEWSPEASSLAGIAMSTTSVAVVYAVMLEFGLNTTDYGKVVLAACFI